MAEVEHFFEIVYVKSTQQNMVYTMKITWYQDRCESELGQIAFINEII